LFRFRRRSDAAVDDGSNDASRADSDGGRLTADGRLEWVATGGVGSVEPSASSAADSPIRRDETARTTRAPSSDSNQRSDPARAATEGMWEVIRPAAIVPEHAARLVLVELARRDLTNGGEWQSEPQLWSRYDGPVPDDASRDPELMGTIHVTYGTPTKYEITLYRVSITAAGLNDGWTVASLTDEALGFGGLTLAQCPRATVNVPPKPFTY
jgi:hypothetical protein